MILRRTRNALCFLGLMMSPAMALKTTLVMQEDTVLRAKISRKSMNRIGLKGDRITQIFGFENSGVTTEKDETNGLLFIRLPENMTEKLECLVMTEGGLSQDLELVPSDIGPTNIVLQSPTHEGDQVNKDSQTTMQTSMLGEPRYMDPRGEDISRSFQESVLRLIKRMATGQGIGLASLPLENAQASGGVSGAPGGEAPRPVGELTFRCVRVVEGDGGTVGGMRGLVWEASNTTEGNISLSETDIMGPGDVAISVDSPVVEPGQTAHIYIVRGHHA